MRSRRATTAALALAAATLAACSSSTTSGGATKRSSPPASTTATRITTTYGQDAALLAGHIHGCTGTTAAAVTAAAASTGMVGKATCQLDGHQVVLYTWKDEASETSSVSLLAGSTLRNYASGTGWVQILGDDATPDAQKAIADTVASSLGGTVHTA